MLKSHETHVISQTNVIQKPKGRESLKFPKDDERKERQLTFTKILRFGTSKTFDCTFRKSKLKYFHCDKL